MYAARRRRRATPAAADPGGTAMQRMRVADHGQERDDRGDAARFAPRARRALLGLAALLALAAGSTAHAQANLVVSKYLQANSDPDGNGQVTVGDTLTFLVRAQSQGFVTLNNVVVTDPMITPASTTCASLTSFQVCDLTGTYVVTAADEAAGVIANTGSATADEIAGARTVVLNTPVVARVTAMTVNKYYQSNSDPDGNGQVTVGDTLTFLVRVQNTGNQPLHNVAINDPRISPASLSCPVLNRFQLCDLTGTTVVTVADEAAGQINNTATVTADEVAGTRTATVNTTVVARTTAMTVNKYLQGNTDPDSNGQVTVGDTLSFLARAQNTGNQPLHNVVVSDPRLTPSTVTCALLNRNQICDLNGTTAVAVADETAGRIDNTATASSDETGARSATLNTAVVARSTSLTLNKYYQGLVDADGNGLVTVGDTLNYLVRVQNTGNLPLTNVVLNDSRITPGTLTCPTLNRSQLCDLSGTTVVTVADEAAGQVANTATATATEIAGSRSATVNTAVTARTSNLTVSKFLQANNDADASSSVTPGDTLTYLVRAQNTGTQPLTNVVVGDNRITPNTLTCATLNRNNICDLTGTYVVTAGDATAGNVTNTATATANEIAGARTTTISTQVAGGASAMLVNTYYWTNTDPDANGAITVGDVITYRVLMQNTGASPLTNVTVSNPLTSPASLNCPTVNAGGICDLFGTYTVTVADETAGVITVTGSATSTEVPGPLTSTISTAVVPRTTGLVLNASYWTNTDGDGNGQVTVGDVVTFRALAQNSGNQPLHNVSVSAPGLSPSSLACPTVNAGGICDLFGTHTVTLADETAGVITIAASVTSDEVPGPINATVNQTVAPRSTSMVLNSYYWTNADADSNGLVTVGDTVTYRVLMQNGGSQPLTNVVVSAPLLSPNSLTCPTVNAGGICDLFGTYTITPADETAGGITIAGSATSTEVPGPLTSSVSTPVIPRNTSMVLNTSYWTNADNDSNGQVTVGDVITYRVLM
jgi:uncharacterized repeat protein (TIGR01451 family)